MTGNMKRILMGPDPQALGGEDLPDLGRDEVEIARLTYVNSVHGEVVSLRAQPNKQDGGVRLLLVDEYQTEFSLKQETYPNTLTPQEVIDVFWFAEPDPFEEDLEHLFSSFFYVYLDEEFEQRVANKLVDEPHQSHSGKYSESSNSIEIGASDTFAAAAIRTSMRQMEGTTFCLDDAVDVMASQEGFTDLMDSRPMVVIVKFEDGSGIGVNATGLDLLEGM